MELAEAAGLQGLADERLSVPSDKDADPGLTVAWLFAGMVAGADTSTASPWANDSRRLPLRIPPPPPAAPQCVERARARSSARGDSG